MPSDPNSPWLTIFTSAAVGALVSSAVTFIGQFLERRSRRNELLLKTAVKLSVHQREFMMQFAKETQTPATLIDPAINAENYFRWLKELLVSEKLSPDADKYRPKTSAQ
jgi:hypothetical protein